MYCGCCNSIPTISPTAEEVGTTAVNITVSDFTSALPFCNRFRLKITPLIGLAASSLPVTVTIGTTVYSLVDKCVNNILGYQLASCKVYTLLCCVSASNNTISVFGCTPNKRNLLPQVFVTLDPATQAAVDESNE